MVIRGFQMLCYLLVITRTHTHDDNSIFNAELFVRDCKNKYWTQSFPCVFSITKMLSSSSQFKLWCKWLGPWCFITLRTRASLGLIILHFGFFWKASYLASQSYTQSSHQLKTYGIITKFKTNHHDLVQTHVWDCSVNVLTQCSKIKFGPIFGFHWCIFFVWQISTTSTPVMSCHSLTWFFNDLFEIFFTPGNDAMLCNIWCLQSILWIWSQLLQWQVQLQSPSCSCHTSS